MFDENYSRAQGAWVSDVKTYGQVFASETGKGGIFWIDDLITARLKIHLRKYISIYYLAFLLFIAILNLVERVAISWQTIVLLLVPGAFLLKEHIITLKEKLGLKKAGPFEFEPSQSAIPPESKNYLTQAPEGFNFAFFILDKFFVYRTKMVLMGLVKERSITKEKYQTLAAAVGVLENDLVATWSALIEAQCAVFKEDKLEPTELGKEYAKSLMERILKSVTPE
jgi:hypothetical protein